MSESPFKQYETERLIIRPMVRGDAAFQLALMNSSDWLRYIGDRGVYTIEEAERYITDNVTEQFKRLGFANYTIVRKKDALPIGVVGLYDRPALEGIDIGFALMSDHYGYGYSYEAANRILRAATHDFNLVKVNAITQFNNIASQKLLEKLGLTFTKMIQLTEDSEDLMFYELL